MKLEQFVLFIDMLGFSEYNNQVVDDESSSEILSFMKNNEKIFKESSLFNNFPFCPGTTLKFENFYSVQVAFISDSIVVNYKPLEVDDKDLSGFFLEGSGSGFRYDTVEGKKYFIDFLSSIALGIVLDRLYQIKLECFSKKGIFLRGGISNGFCEIMDSFAVGKGLSEAHFIESQLAKMPIVCISEHLFNNNQLINIIIETHSASHEYVLLETTSPDSEKLGLGKLWFFDYIAYALTILSKVPPARLNYYLIFFTQHKSCLEGKIREIKEGIITSDSVIEKYTWLCKYHNDAFENVLCEEFVFNKDKQINQDIKDSLRDLKIDSKLLEELI